jgi:hypothetical protein
MQALSSYIMVNHDQEKEKVGLTFILVHVTLHFYSHPWLQHYFILHGLGFAVFV